MNNGMDSLPSDSQSPLRTFMRTITPRNPLVVFLWTGSCRRQITLCRPKVSLQRSLRLRSPHRALWLPTLCSGNGSGKTSHILPGLWNTSGLWASTSMEPKEWSLEERQTPFLQKVQLALNGLCTAQVNVESINPSPD